MATSISLSDFEDQFAQAFLKEFTIFLEAISVKLDVACKDKLIKEITDNAIYQSLLSGELEAEFGLDINVKEWIMGGMLEIIRNGIKVQFDSVNYAGGVIFALIKVTYENQIPRILLNDSHAEYTYISSLYPSGNTIPWLEWLFGVKEPVIYGYEIIYGSFSDSRSGQAKMVHGGDWELPYEYQESLNRNFILDSIYKVGIELEKTLKELI